MSQTEKVKEYLIANFKEIQEARTKQGFSWGPTIEKLLVKYPNIDLDPNSRLHRERVRNVFLRLRENVDRFGDRFGDIIPDNLAKEYGIDLKPKVIPGFYSELKSISPQESRRIRRILYDVEVSPNVCLSWGIGRKVYLDTNSIVKERSIICICWKEEDETNVHSLRWNDGDDKELLTEFSKVINSADEIVGHNSDSFDTKWVRGRCLYHNIPLSPKINSIDTLKLARKQFRLNSNKLDYLGQFLGLGRKIDTGGFELWKKICLDNDKESLEKMVAYCCQDVLLLEKVYKKLREYSPKHTFRLRNNGYKDMQGVLEA